MNISKTTSRQIAFNLLEKKKKQITILEELFSKMVRDEYLKTLPKTVLEFFKEHPEYTKTKESMHLKGNGFYSEIVYLLLPVPTNKNFNFEFEPKEDISKDLIKMKNEIRKEKEKYKESIDKISATLYSLRSFSKIRESFPEAAEFLPQQEIKSILNIKEIRGLLK